MLEAKYKEYVHSHIADVLSAIDTLKSIIREAAEVQDFPALCLITDRLPKIINEAQYSLDNEIPEHKLEEALKWWVWTDIEFGRHPEATFFSSMAFETLQEILETKKED